MTLVTGRNNFWGLLHRGGRLVRSFSAGGVGPRPARATTTAAAGVAAAVGDLLRPARRVALTVNLVNWSRDRRWRAAWAKLWDALPRRRRLRVRVRPVRPHNGVRPPKARRT